MISNDALKGCSLGKQTLINSVKECDILSEGWELTNLYSGSSTLLALFCNKEFPELVHFHSICCGEMKGGFVRLNLELDPFEQIAKFTTKLVEYFEGQAISEKKELTEILKKEGKDGNLFCQ